MSPTTTSYAGVATTSSFVLTLLTSPGSAALRIENSELPTEIQVDESAHREVARRLGAGVQVYDCDPNAHSFRFREPQADLYDLETGIQRGLHFIGPQAGTAQWTDFDGSRVVARVVPPRVGAPPPADPSLDVEWLKLDVIDHSGIGILSTVSFIQRVLTFEGKPPPSCEDVTTISRPYTALYVFWEPL